MVKRSVLKSNREDYGRLISIAQGIVIETDPTFVPSGYAGRPKLRKKYQIEVPNAVYMLIHKQWKESTVLLLPTDMVKDIPGVHFSPIHWTPNKDKASGRVLGDTSNGDRHSRCLNGDGPEGKKLVRELMIKRWGAIHHPTLDDLVQMVLEAVDIHGWEEVELWKMDLAAAFNLMDFSPRSALLLAFELTDGMSVIHTTGMFGWTGTPYVFQVIVRVLCAILKPVLKDKAKMYVDDMFGAAGKANRAHDMQQADEHIKGLLGPHAVAPAKTAYGRSITLLGWLFDLDLRIVTCSDKNILKAVYAFFMIDLDRPVTVQEVERAASYASRYTILCRAMKPYSAALHKAAADYGGHDHPRPRRLSAEAQCDIILWRAYLCLLRLQPANFARSLDSFRDREATVLIEYDASLEALGDWMSTRLSRVQTCALRICH
eukprot:gene47495-biopygen34833